MTLNAYLVLAVVVLVLLSPLILLSFWIWLPWLILQRRGQHREGYRTLLPFMARTVENYARVMIRGEAPDGDWRNVSRNLDHYIGETRSPRIWRLQLMCLIMEIAPILRLRLPFSLMTETARLEFVERFLIRPRGLMRIVSLGRQLMRLCYYATPATHARMGFVPMRNRGAMRVKPDPVIAEVAA